MIKIIKIENLQDELGRFDYKGIDISKNVAGSQVYLDENNTAYLKTQSDIPDDNDVTLVSSEEYTNALQRYKNETVSELSEIERLEADMNEAIVELTMLISLGGM